MTKLFSGAAVAVLSAFFSGSVFPVIAIAWAVLAQVFLALASADVAHRKGYSGFAWGVLGLVFGVLALLAIGFRPAKHDWGS